jgi:L-2-hydroxyglutarate oxidase LhgO
MTTEYDVAVIGAGLVGLATARELTSRNPRLRVAVLEKEVRVASHQSGRNSGVVHAGLYYAPGSLKSRLCREGRVLLREFALEHDIPLETPGKLVVAVREDELPKLRQLHERGIRNGLRGLRLLAPTEIRELEPAVEGLAAIHVPESGIVDFRIVAEALADSLAGSGTEVLLERPVTGVRAASDGITLETPQGPVRARSAISCGGANSDRIAAMAGADTRGVRVVPFRGSYYQLASSRRDLIRGLVYPVPDPTLPFLGVHFTPRVDGGVLIGPNAVLTLARHKYGRAVFDARDAAATATFPGFWRLAREYRRYAAAEVARDLVKPLFLREMQRYVPELRSEDVERGPTGVRAQLLRRDGRLEDDFVITRSPRFLHVLNAPSPAATASLSIAKLVANEAGDLWR